MADNSMILAAFENDDELMFLLNTEEKEQSVCHKMDIDNLNDEQFRSMFRFKREDMTRLCVALRLPTKVVCENRTVCSGMQGLCILIWRLAYPNRLEDLSHVFGRSKAELSYLFNTVLNLIDSQHGHLLENINPSWLAHHKLDEMVDSVWRCKAPLSNCWGFIDGTVRPICRPQENERLVFNGHKRVHGLKFQSIVTPSGMIAHLYGPIEGRRHDAGMLRESGIETQMEHCMTKQNNEVYSVYGDPAYPICPYIIPPFRGGVISAQQMRFNKKMSAVRVCVEWTFGKILSLFAFLDYKKNQKLYLQPVGKYYRVAAILTNCHTILDYKKNQKLYLQPVGKYYRVAAILTNCHTILYGSETGKFFSLCPPTLNEYLS